MIEEMDSPQLREHCPQRFLIVMPLRLNEQHKCYETLGGGGEEASVNVRTHLQQSANSIFSSNKSHGRASYAVWFSEQSQTSRSTRRDLTNT